MADTQKTRLNDLSYDIKIRTDRQRDARADKLIARQC